MCLPKHHIAFLTVLKYLTLNDLLYLFQALLIVMALQKKK